MITSVTTPFGDSIPAILNIEGSFRQVCKISDISTDCVQLGEGIFRIYFVSPAALHFGSLRGYDFTNPKDIKAAINDQELRKECRQYFSEHPREATAEEEQFRKINDIIVTTADLQQPYDIIGPVFFQLSNKGFFTSTYSQAVKRNEQMLTTLKQLGQMSDKKSDWGALWGEFGAGQNNFDTAFFVAVQELKKRTFLLGGDAVVGMRQDFDLDTTSIQYFYLQMYGTAVKLKQ